MTGISRREALLGIGGAALAAAAPRVAAAQRAAGAPSAPPQNGAGFYRFRVGEFECFSIGDSQVRLPAYPVFGENASEEAVGASLRTAFVDPAGLQLSFSPLLIRRGDEVWLVDAGNGKGALATGELLRHLATIGVRAADVGGVILTHMHFDHFGGLFDAAGELVFANATHFLNQTEHDFWSAAPELATTNLSADLKQLIRATNAQAFASLARSGKLRLVEDGAQLSTGLTVQQVGGHTPGQQAVLLESGGEKFEMLVDVAHHYILSLRHPEWHVQLDFDPKEGARVRRRTLDRVAREQTRVMFYHAPWPGIGHVVPDKDAFAWLPVEWEW